MNKSCVYSIKCKVGQTGHKKLILNFFKWYHCPENVHQVFLVQLDNNEEGPKDK